MRYIPLIVTIVLSFHIGGKWVAHNVRIDLQETGQSTIRYSDFKKAVITGTVEDIL